MTIYCTYLTVYSGNKLPPFYIGSTSVKKIDGGYRGSVSSQKYKNIWEQEQKDNPHLFKTIILTKHDNREEALCKEENFHMALSVHKNSLYVNMATANGKFYITCHTEKTKNKISISKKGIPKSDECKQKLSKHFCGRPRKISDEERKRLSLKWSGIGNPRRMKDNKRSEEELLKLRKTMNSEEFKAKRRLLSRKQFGSEMYTITNTITDHVEILYISDFCKNYNTSKAVYSSVKKHGKYKGWIFKSWSSMKILLDKPLDMGYFLITN